VARKYNGTVTTWWLYQDGMSVVWEKTASGDSSRFVYGTNPQVPDYVVKNGTEYLMIADQLGDVRLVVNASTGVIAQRIDYDAYGRITSDSSPGYQPFGYAGGLWETTSGLVRMGRRDYDPGTGRWTTKDPLGVRGGANVYEYVGGDPINRRDPDGLQFFPPILEVPVDPVIDPAPSIPPEILEDAIRINRPNNRVQLPDGRKVDLSGDPHFNKGPGAGGGPCPTPHTHEPIPPPPGHTGWQGEIVRPATLQDILDAIEHIMLGSSPAVVPPWVTPARLPTGA